MPVIRHLLAAGHQVTAAGNKEQQQLLRRIFPAIPLVDLSGYEVKYAKSKRGFLPAIFRQLPRIMLTIHKEHIWLKKVIIKERIDAVISDNRYGLFHRTVPCVILTHQPAVKIGLGKFADRMLRRLHYHFLGKFRAVWIVDEAGKPNLGGELSHPSTLPRNAAYAGLLSQMAISAAPKKLTHLLLLLSGPEPQRTLLENILWQAATSYQGSVVFIAGKSTAAPPFKIPPHIEYHRQLAAAALQPLLDNASIVICRSGYSTLMDLALLNKKAILIPTPGQTEQEYLAKHLQAQGIFPFYRQDGFNIGKALAEAENFPFKAIGIAGVNSRIGALLDSWIKEI